MRKLLLLCTLLTIGFFHIATAQKAVTDGKFVYDITIQSDKSTPVAKSFEGASLTLYVKGSQSRTDMVNGLGTESTLYDNKAGKGTILKEYSGQKLMITLGRENWQTKNAYFRNMRFTTSDPATKVINGFTCKKAVATLSDGSELVVYYEPDIQLNNKEYNNAFFNLPGLPVQYEIKSGNLRFLYTLKSVSYDVLPTARFDAPKSGYRVMTYEETQQLKKGGK